jgi:flagellar hook protein FlgE
MTSAFSIALSALNADSTAVNVVGNNLANLNTTGFKTSEVSFQDLVNQAINGGQNTPGFGVAPPGITPVYSQGAIQTTNGQYDAAIQGDGFFMVSGSDGGQLYTRNGSFTVNAQGDLLTNTGQNVEGWSSTTGAVNTTGPISNIVLPGGLLAMPIATQNISATINLDASQAVGSTGATFSTPMQIYDSLGESHILNVSFTKTAANAWTYTVSIDGGDLTGGTAGTPSTLATGQMTFGPQGNMLTPAAPPPASNTAIPLTITGLADGATTPMTVNWNIYSPTTSAPNITQVAEISAASDPTQDGAAAAQVTSISIGDHGQILAQYSNAQPVVVAQLALATFRNPESLLQVGNGNLAAGAATSQASTGLPDSGDRGDILGGALEASNVDIATEFTNLIVYQRSYEANAKVVTTADTLSEDTIDIIPAT